MIEKYFNVVHSYVVLPHINLKNLITNRRVKHPSRNCLINIVKHYKKYYFLCLPYNFDKGPKKLDNIPCWDEVQINSQDCLDEENLDAFLYAVALRIDYNSFIRRGGSLEEKFVRTYDETFRYIEEGDIYYTKKYCAYGDHEQDILIPGDFLDSEKVFLSDIYAGMDGNTVTDNKEVLCTIKDGIQRIKDL